MSYVNKIKVEDIYYDLKDEGAIRFNESQSLTSSQKEQARSNIGAINVAIDNTLTVTGSAADAKKTGDEIANLESSVTEINESLNGKVDGWYIENGTLYLTSNGEIVGDGGISGIGGGGGGGGGGGSVLTITNRMPWLSTTIRHGAPLSLSISWSSMIDNTPTGVGTLKVIVNNAIRETLNVQQGIVTVSVGDYLAIGNNTVKLVVTDIYGNIRSIIYSISSIVISVSSSFDDTVVYSNSFIFPYTPVGAVEKTVHFKLDGVEQQTYTTSISNRELDYIVPAQEHGSHSIEVWFTCTINGETVSSNHLYYEYVYVEANVNTPIIVSSFNENTVMQYSTVSIHYQVYNPAEQETEVDIYEGETLSTSLTVGRDVQTYIYRAISSGAQTITFVVGSTEKTISLTVTPMDIDVEAEESGLQLYLSSRGRNNAESNPGTWSYNNISATFSGFNWTSNGWKRDEDGATVLRVNNGARVAIPYEIFNEDFRTSGRTIEIEFATRDVRNYNTSIISCVSGGRGFNISSQDAVFSSEQSTISGQFKDDEHVRLSFVIQKRSEQRLILLYINGIVSGCVQYPDNDDFSQVTPVGIILGGDDATLDVYTIRVYNRNLTRFQVLNNWIADTQNGSMLVDLYNHNNIFDEYGNIVISKLPSDLPYMVISGTLPTYKGNKLTVSGEYVDQINQSNSFTFENAQIDVQGTSSQYYARKNYKIKFNGGFTNEGETSSKYAMNGNAIPVKTFTFKADVASSEGANNVELARLYNDTCPYKTPYQIENSKVRQGIDGFPIVIFHNDGNNVYFLGKYNFNNDKGTEEVFGFSEGDESWEILNNTSNRVLWKSSDYSGTDWLNDFEARYPEDNTDSTNLAAFAAWLVSTDQAQATNNALDQSVTYTEDDISTTYTNDTAAYRLAKFRNELEDWAELDSILFYYLFTELFLMVDSRAKNAFPSKLGGDKWCILPYDFDTALGINNEGSLAFSYNLEDIDRTSGNADVFNGQQSVLWINLRQAFYNELKTMYQSLRSNNSISYAKVEKMFEDHQSKWPEAVFNEDAQFKYIDPLIDDNDASYLGMLQGSKEEQRKWWLYNRFRYIDSKYNAGDALTDVIQLRGYAKANITVTPYADIYPAVKYGSYLVSGRGTRNVSMTLTNPLDNVNDTEIYIYSASQLSSVGDISGLKVGFADFSKAIKLQSLKIGDTTPGYTNGNLTELYLGNNSLLQTIDVRNCIALSQTVNLSGCTALENVYFDGTAVTGVTLPNGGMIKVLHLPDTITNLTVMNQTQISDFVCNDFSNITTLRLENVSNEFDIFEIIDSMPAGGRVRLFNFHLELDDLSDLIDFYDELDTMRGLDQNGNNVETAQLYGTVHATNADGATLATLGTRYPGVQITYDNLTSTLYYYDFYGTTLLYSETIYNGSSGTWASTPSKPSDTAQYTFGLFVGWALSPEQAFPDANARTNVIADRNVYAAFVVNVRTYTATFKLGSDDGGTTLYTQQDVPYGTTPTYGGQTPVSSRNYYEFDNRWIPALSGITGNTTYVAVFKYIGSTTRHVISRLIEDVENTTVTSIGACAFTQCKSLVSVSLPNVISINGRDAFNQCTELASVSLPSLTSISGDYAFGHCSRLVSISLPSLTSISGFTPFGYCSRLASALFPNLTSISGDNTFFSCGSLVSVSLPNLTSINANQTFYGCSALTELSLPKLTVISSEYSFRYCSRLTSISLPAITSIGAKVFYECSGLTTLILGNADGVATLANTNAFYGADNCIIYVPDALVNDYKSANNWSTYASRIKGISELSI